MNDAMEAASRKAEETYNSAADYFDAAPLAFWDRYGQRTVTRLNLKRSATVLDVCCGTGASALPAARAIGADGTVIAVDLADKLLELGRAKANAAGLRNVQFRRADMTALDFPDGHFDAIVCVFGIFFVSDMEKQIAELWRMVRPGGKLAITTWGQDLFAPANEIWQTAVRRVRPDLHSTINPWDRITTPVAVCKLFADAGIGQVDVVPDEGYQVIRAPEDFWTIALGSGLRWTVDQMGADAADSVRRETLEILASKHVDRIRTDVIYAIASK